MTKRYRDFLDNIYDDRAQLPEYIRPLHRALTGLPDRGAALREATPLGVFLEDLGWLIVFMLGAGVGAELVLPMSFWSGVGLVIMIVGALGTIGRLRRLVVGHVHEATHGIVTAFYTEAGHPERVARWIAECILDIGSAISFSLNGQDYRRLHVLHHMEENLGTLSDPDGAVLFDWGLWPSKTSSLYSRLWLTLLNPAWHVSVFASRIQTNLLTGPVYRRLMGLLVLGALVGSSLVLQTEVWLAAIFFPFGPGFQIASALQVITEHPYGYEHGADDLDTLAERTWERIPYTPMPKQTPLCAPIVWLGWTGQTALHIAERLTVLDDTMIAHGYHHLAWPIGRPFNDWWNTSAHFIRAYDEGALPEGADTRLVCGLGGALERQGAFFRESSLSDDA